MQSTVGIGNIIRLEQMKHKSTVFLLLALLLWTGLTIFSELKKVQKLRVIFTIVEKELLFPVAFVFSETVPECKAKKVVLRTQNSVTLEACIHQYNQDGGFGNLYSLKK